MSRFKVGDKIVAVSHKTLIENEGRVDALHPKIGDALVIIDISRTGRVLYFSDPYYGMYQEDVEHEKVYNSPLYQALK